MYSEGDASGKRGRKPNRRGLETAKKVYATVSLLGTKATVDRIAYVAGLPRRTVYYSLSRLVERGFLVKERRGLRVFYRVAKPFSKEGFEGRKETYPAGEPPVYVYARKAKEIIERYGLEADLIGAAKIHLETYPEHKRITVDVDVVATREHANILVNLLADVLGLKPYAGYGGVSYKLEKEGEKVGFDIYVDSIKEGPKPVWNLRKYLRNHGRLLLEHALVAKLIRSDFDKRTDAYDVYVALPFADLKAMAELTSEVAQQSPEVVDRIKENLEAVKEYVSENGPEKVPVFEGLVRRYLEKIGETNRVLACLLKRAR